MIGVNPYTMSIRQKLIELDKRFIHHNTLEDMTGGSRVSSHILPGTNPMFPISEMGFVAPTNLAHHSSVMMDGGFHKGSMSKTHPLEKDFTTKKGSKVHHIKGHYIQEAVAPYMTAGKRKPPSFKNVFNDIKQVGTYIKPLTKGVASALNKKIISGIEAAGRPSIHAGKRKPPSFKNVFNDIKQDGTYIKPLTKGVASALNKKIISGIEGAGRKPSARAQIVKKIMSEQGLSMIEASKYVKQHGLYTK